MTHLEEPHKKKIYLAPADVFDISRYAAISFVVAQYREDLNIAVQPVNRVLI